MPLSLQAQRREGTHRRRRRRRHTDTDADADTDTQTQAQTEAEGRKGTCRHGHGHADTNTGRQTRTEICEAADIAPVDAHALLHGADGHLYRPTNKLHIKVCERPVVASVHQNESVDPEIGRPDLKALPFVGGELVFLAQGRGKLLVEQFDT